MAKGRNTTVIGVRVTDGVYIRIKSLAEKDHATVSEWCKASLIRAAGLLPDGTIRSHHKKNGSKEIVEYLRSVNSSG